MFVNNKWPPQFHYPQYTWQQTKNTIHHIKQIKQIKAKITEKSITFEVFTSLNQITFKVAAE